MSQTACEIAQREVTGEINVLDDSINELEKRVDTLIERLASVLTQPETPPSGECAGDKCLVPLADDIRGRRRRIASISKSIQDCLDRLEL